MIVVNQFQVSHRKVSESAVQSTIKFEDKIKTDLYD